MVKPTIIISGLLEKISSNEMIANIKSQNKFLDDAELKVISIFGKTKFSAIVETDSKSFNLIMALNENVLNIGWARCRVKEYIDIKESLMSIYSLIKMLQV